MGGAGPSHGRIGRGCRGFARSLEVLRLVDPAGAKDRAPASPKVGRLCEHSVRPPAVRSKYGDYRTNQCTIRFAFLGTRFLLGTRTSAFRSFGFRVVVVPASLVRFLPCSARALSDPSRAGLPFPGSSRTGLLFPGPSQSAQQQSDPWLSAKHRSPRGGSAAWRVPIVRPDRENFGASRESDSGPVDCTRTELGLSSSGSSEPASMLSVPSVSESWREATFRSAGLARPVLRSPLLCWCSLSQSGLFRWPGKPGVRLVGST